MQSIGPTSSDCQPDDASVPACTSQSRRRLLGTALAAATGAVMPAGQSLAQAPAFPSRTVKIVVPYAPGGGLDAMARVLAERLQRTWGQPVVVENKTGASTIIGAQAVTRAAPDGHTLLLTSEATITSNPFLFDKLPYDPMRELAPISQLIGLPQMVVAHPSVPAQNLVELVAVAKSKPNAISYASYGSGSLPHLLFEGLKMRTGVELVQVPYRGIIPAVMAALAGEVQLTLAGVAAAQAHLAAGKLKALAVAHATRLPEFPQVPTLREAGFADIDPHASWFGLFATAGTPDHVVQKIQRDVASIGADPAFTQGHLASRGFMPVFSTPAAFSRFIREDALQKSQLIRLTGAKTE